MQSTFRRRETLAFTLIELLVVVAIVAILAAILFPVFAQAKGAAKQSVNLSNLKQIGVASMLYADEFDHRLPTDERITWGSFYWLFMFKPYLKGQPADAGTSPSGVYWNPTAPETNFQVLQGTQANKVWPEPAQSWGLKCYRPAGANCQELRFYTTYGINEHVVRDPGGPALTSWQEPAVSFMVLEVTDTETEGDELDELYSRTLDCQNIGTARHRDATFGGHAGGTTILYLDSHAKWHKTVYHPRGVCTVDRDGELMLTFPPYAGGEPDETRKIRGWTMEF